jgi:DNA-binding winged helix-turn-helix (wHTH) protein/tetratricopeptide (TPR) repeat protein
MRLRPGGSGKLEQQPANRLYRFGSFSLDVARRELRSGDEEVELQPRVFDLLVYLVRHSERAVDKDELQDAVWPGMLVTETALTRAVMKARKAVGDDASRQRIIKTVHGHGYRFVAELEPTASGDPAKPGQPPDGPAPAKAPADPAASESPPAARVARRRRALLLGAALIAVLATALTWMLLRPPPELEAETRIAVLPLTDRTGDAELAWTRLGLMSYVSNLIEADGSLPVVADGSVVSLSENIGWSGKLGDEADAELLAKLRRVYGATHFLAMELESAGRALRMNFTLQQPDGSLQRGTMVGDEGTVLGQGVVQSVFGMLLGKRRRGGEFTLVSADPFNNEAFARGMDLSLQGRCAEAVPFFRIIIEQEPSLFAPRFEYAACQRILGEPDEAEAVLDELIAEQRLIGPTRQLAQALMTRGVVYNRTGRLDLAEAAHREALAVADSVGAQELIGRILQNLSIVYEDRGDFRHADDLLDRAVLAYQAGGRESMPGQLFSGKANLRMDRGELVEAQEYLQKALQAFREVGDRRNEAMMLNNTGYLLREMGRLGEAEGYHLRSLEIRENIGDRVGVGRVYGQLSAVYSAQGRHAEAAEAARMAAETAAETRDRLFEGTSLAQWAAAEVGLDRRAEARSHYRQSRAVFEAIQDRMRVLQVDVMLARMDLEDGDPGGAEAVALRVLDDARRASLMQPEIEAMELLGDVAVARGDTAAAIEEYAAALARVRESTWSAKETDIAVRLLEAYLDAGDAESAAPLAGALAAREPGVAVLKARARFAAADGDAAGAAALLEEAKTLAGADWDPESEELLSGYRRK